MKPVDGSGSAQPLSTSSGTPESWSVNGELAITDRAPDDWNISILSSTDPKRMPKPFAADSTANEMYPDFSPDGRWLAYASNRTGREEVYVRPYPGPGEPIRVSINGGRQPAWSRTTGELFFTVSDLDTSTDSNTVMVVNVTTTPTFKAGIPRALPVLVRWTLPMRGYDVSADGRRFFTLRETKATTVPSPTQMIVVLNWVEELKRRVPSK